MKTVVGLIKKLAKKEGTESADNILAGMLIVHKDYFSLKKALAEYLKD